MSGWDRKGDVGIEELAPVVGGASTLVSLTLSPHKKDKTITLIRQHINRKYSTKLYLLFIDESSSQAEEAHLSAATHFPSSKWLACLVLQNRLSESPTPHPPSHLESN